MISFTAANQIYANGPQAVEYSQVRNVHRDIGEGCVHDRRNPDRQANNSNDVEYPRSAETRAESQHTGRSNGVLTSTLADKFI